jgi:hypothetical protein
MMTILFQIFIIGLVLRFESENRDVSGKSNQSLDAYSFTAVVIAICGVAPVKYMLRFILRDGSKLRTTSTMASGVVVITLLCLILLW